MAQKETHGEQEKFSLFSLAPAGLAAMGSNYLGEFSEVQTDLFGKWQEINQYWLGRIGTEANLASELASHLTSARSVPDAVTVCQEWSSRRFQMMAEDGQHLLTDVRELAETSARLLPNGRQSKSPNIST